MFPVYGLFFPIYIIFTLIFYKNSVGILLHFYVITKSLKANQQKSPTIEAVYGKKW